MEDSVKSPKRRLRTTFTSDQIQMMEDTFQVTHYPDVKTRQLMSQKIGLPESKLQIWFQNRRAKWRKHEKLSHFGGLQFVTESTQDFVPAPVSYVRVPRTVSSPAVKDSPTQDTVRSEPPANWKYEVFESEVVVNSAAIKPLPLYVYGQPPTFYSQMNIFSGRATRHDGRIHEGSFCPHSVQQNSIMRSYINEWSKQSYH